MRSIICLLTSLLLLVPALSFAAEISIYETPDANAKVIGKIDPANGIVPIFSSNDGKWMKIGNPKNGDVGWAKSDDINSGDVNTSITFTQRTITNGKSNAPQTVRFIQYGKPDKLTDEQAQQMMQKIQLQQRSVHNAIQHMINQMSTMYNIDWNMMENGYPIIMPLVIIPSPKLPPEHKTAPAPTVKTKK